MDSIALIKKYYKEDSDLYKILVDHSEDVMNKALSVAEKHPELDLNTVFIREAAMLHDIGIFLTNAPSIDCFGIAPYICHGYLGRELLDNEGFPEHGLVCERHTGIGISLEQIVSRKMPLPHREMIPLSMEEKVICFADCFFSKTRLGKEKTVENVRKGISKYGTDSLAQFDQWCNDFL